MLYLAFIYHMHQPYYKNLLTQEAELPWVRLHGVKDYVDMVQILEKYPSIHQTFNLVPSLLEQVEDYTNRTVKDKFLELSYKPARELTQVDKDFILERFFSINKDTCIVAFPRYYQLCCNKRDKKEFNTQDYLDLQAWFNLAWIDPSFRESIPELKAIVTKGRFFTEEEKRLVLDKQLEILEEIFPVYRKFADSGQVEFTVSPYYHPILPLLYSTMQAREANPKSFLPTREFAYPKDAEYQVNDAVKYYKEKLGRPAVGMWPSEESVCEEILPMLIKSGIKWIVTDEGMLFKSLKLTKRNARLLYQPHKLVRKEGEISIIFRDRNLSDLIGFVYQRLTPKQAVNDFMGHLENIAKAFKNQDILVPIAMDGENAWEYFANDGHDFLNELYGRLSEAKFLKTTTVTDYLQKFPPKYNIKRLAAGSWIFSDFGKWIGNPYKNKAWEHLAEAREVLESLKDSPEINLELAWKQMHVLEGSDWFWWFGEDPNGDFDKLFRMHMANLYTILKKEIPPYLSKPITP